MIITHFWRNALAYSKLCRHQRSHLNLKFPAGIINRLFSGPSSSKSLRPRTKVFWFHDFLCIKYLKTVFDCYLFTIYDLFQTGYITFLYTKGFLGHTEGIQWDWWVGWVQDWCRFTIMIEFNNYAYILNLKLVWSK